METVQTIWSFTLFFGLLLFAQLFGVLLFFVLKGRPHFLAHLLSLSVPVLLSVVFLWMVLLYRYYQAHPNDHDGGQLYGAVLAMLLSGFLQIVFGTLVQIALHRRANLCAKSLTRR